VLLPTAIIYVRNRIGAFMPCRAILDSASQLNFITSRLASQLNWNHRRSQTSISGIGESSMIPDKTVDILVQSRDASYRAAFTAVVTHSITDYQPHFNIYATSWRIRQNISLADPNFNQSQRIDLLLGAGLFFEIISMGQIHLDRALPTLQNTKLCWIASEGLSSNMPTHKSVLQASIKDPADHSDDILAAIVKRFWEIEDFTSSKPSLLPEDLRCEQLFTENCIRLENGQYSVRLLSTSGFESLGDSYCLVSRV